MFKVSAPGPVATELPKFAAKATVGLVNLAYEAVANLCKQHGKALSRSFGNFDRVVGLG